MFKLHQLHPSGTYVSSSYLTTPYIIIMLELDSKNSRFKELFSFSFWPSACLVLRSCSSEIQLLLIDFKHFPLYPPGGAFVSYLEGTGLNKQCFFLIFTSQTDTMTPL